MSRRELKGTIVRLLGRGMHKMIVLGVLLLLMTVGILGGCEVSDPEVVCGGCGDVSAACEEKPSCELLGFGIHPEY